MASSVSALFPFVSRPSMASGLSLSTLPTKTNPAVSHIPPTQFLRLNSRSAFSKTRKTRKTLRRNSLAFASGYRNGQVRKIKRPAFPKFHPAHSGWQTDRSVCAFLDERGVSVHYIVGDSWALTANLRGRAPSWIMRVYERNTVEASS